MRRLRCCLLSGLAAALLLGRRAAGPPEALAPHRWTARLRGAAPRRPGPRRRGRAAEKTARGAVPLLEAEGAEELRDTSPAFEELVAAVCGSPASGSAEPEFELVLPEESDLDAVADLCKASFDRFVEQQKSTGEDFGGLSGLLNQWVDFRERQLKLGGLRKRLARFVRAPSLRRPQGSELERGWSLGVVLRPRSGADGALVAYFEVLPMPPDFDEGGGGLGREPYLDTVCVAPAYQGRGLGRKMLNLAEAIVRDGWKGQRMYLVTDNNPVVQSLYTKGGYTTLRRERRKENISVYMCKELLE